MPEQFEEEIREFLIESAENLARLDCEIVELEHRPDDAKRISSVFRTIHTIKGTCGFFGFDQLGSVAHLAENILCQVRDGQCRLTPELISLVLEAVDRIKALLAKIELEGSEGLDESKELRAKLEAAHRNVAAMMQLEAAHPEIAEREAAKNEAALAESTIRVDVSLLDKLMNLVGELVLARNQLLQDIGNQSVMSQQTLQRLNMITSELQEGVMKTRMQPVGVVWNKMPRIVRDLAARSGKKIRIELEGAGTELDKTIIEAIKDPLTHMVRNSCDHGIEMPEERVAKHKNVEGILLLRAYHEGGVVNLEICDDGTGLDVEVLKKKAIEKGLIGVEQGALMSDTEARRLIFLPGFSTAEQVTELSGRGVGMDVVKTNIEKIGGSVEALNREPHGTILRLKIPLTLAIIPGLVVSLNSGYAGIERRATPREHRFVVPQANLVELVRLEGKGDLKLVEELHGTQIFHHRGKLLPLVHLSRLLHLDKGHAAAKPLTNAVEEGISIVVLQAEDCQLGLLVDHIRDTQEIVVKPLGKQLKSLSFYSGATIMGDGQPALILDAAGLARLAGLLGQTMQIPMAKSAARESVGPRGAKRRESQMMLLFRAGRFGRLAFPLALVARLEAIDAKTIEFAVGRPVLNYRGEILPLVSLGALLEGDGGELKQPDGPMQVIVFDDGVQQVGMMVDRIEDILDEEVSVKRNSAVRGLLGSAMLRGRITDLVDLQAVVAAANERGMPMLAGSSGFQVEVLQ